MSAICFRYARRDEYDRIADFLNRYWAKDHIYARSRPLFDWTFSRPDHWDGDTYSFAIAELNEDLIGILGAIPYTFQSGKRRMRAAWIVNYSVRPDHRKGTTAFQLLSMFHNERFPVVIASGLNPATTLIYRVLRGQVLPNMPRHFVCFPNAVERFMNLLTLAHPDLASDDCRRLAAAVACREPLRQKRSQGQSIPHNWDSVEWAHFSDGMTGAVRDANYLDWRYRRHPCFEYRFVTWQDDDGCGLAVWRLEVIQRLEQGRRIDVDRIGRVLEFLPVSSRNSTNLLDALMTDIAEADAIGADFYGYHSETRAILQANGFPACDGIPGSELIPSRFQPLDSNTGPLVNAMFVPADLPICCTTAPCQWYWTKSDSDQDRPN